MGVSQRLPFGIANISLLAHNVTSFLVLLSEEWTLGVLY